jgi:hypothetical protein
VAAAGIDALAPGALAGGALVPDPQAATAANMAQTSSRHDFT